MSYNYYHEKEYYDRSGNKVADELTFTDWAGNLHTTFRAVPQVGSGIPAIIMVAFLISSLITMVLNALFAHAELIYRIGLFLIVYASMPVMLVLQHFLLKRKGGMAPEAKAARRVHMILSASVFSALAIFNYFAMQDHVVNGEHGFHVFLLCFAPLLFHSIATSVFLIATRKSATISLNRAISAKALNVSTCSFFFLILAAQWIGSFRYSYIPEFWHIFSFVGGIVMLVIMELFFIVLCRIPSVCVIRNN